jgi:catechol 2,3-dioxygenase-like lactoylglutathione lyase family enzyme
MTALASEIRMVTLSVRSLERSAKFYREAVGYAERGRGALPAALAAPWRIPPGQGGQFALLSRPGSSTGMLRLVEFTAPGESIWGDYSRFFDYGHYALNFRVPDLTVAHRNVLAAGAKPKSKPTYWTVLEGFGAWDSLSFDPDGVTIDVYQTDGRPDLFPPLEGTGDIETMAIHVADADRSRDFYAALGFEVFFDRTIREMGEFFHLEKHVGLRDVNMIMPGALHVGAIEIVQLVGQPGVSISHRQRPPNVGILSISFETRDLAAALRVAQERGGRFLAGPVSAEVPVYGRIETLTCEGPDGEMLEFFRRT